MQAVFQTEALAMDDLALLFALAGVVVCAALRRPFGGMSARSTKSETYASVTEELV